MTDVLHLTDCESGGVPAVIDAILGSIPGSAIFINKSPQSFNNKYSIKAELGFRRTINPIIALKIYLNLENKVKKLSPKIIHAHSSFGGVYGAILSWRLKIPLVYTPHASPSMIPNQSILNRLLANLEGLTCRAATNVIACSADEAEALHSRCLKKKIVIVPNGVKFEKNNGKIEWDILAIGRISKQKRPDYFINIVSSLRIKFPDLKVGWVGSGKPLEDDCNIKWISEVSELEIENMLNRSNIFLSTSDYEGLSLAALRAACAGCNMVLRNTTGNRAPVLLGANGYLFNTREEGINVITEILQSEPIPDENKRIERSTKATDLFSLQRQISSHVAIYKNILK